MLTHAELPKAQYAVGYFTEMGLGCPQDASGATEWYVRAADQGDVRAKQRLATIHAAANGVRPEATAGNSKSGKRSSMFATSSLSELLFVIDADLVLT